MRLFSLLSLCFISCFLSAQNVSDFIIVDQFGYRPISEKIAILRNPKSGADASENYTPGTNYVIIDKSDGLEVYTNTISVWNSGVTDTASGDQLWHFDFTNFTTEGDYYILDKDHNVKSFDFTIGEDVYQDVLKHAVRSFFYQRSGFKKEAIYAGIGWADEASHIGALQDKNCRVFNDPTNASTEKDLHGGWYDAGDQNRYTQWTGRYVIELLKAYSESQDVWKDNYGIPESGNGVPDILDEVKWGLNHLLRLQKTDGSLISIIGCDGASPPSSGTAQSLYGNVNTISTSRCAATFAKAAIVFAEYGDANYATTLQSAALKAYNWAIANPRVIWKNNDASYNSSGVGAGQQDSDNDYDRDMSILEAALYMFELTNDTKYRDYFDANYDKARMIMWTYVYPFDLETQETLLQYSQLQNATVAVKNDIINTYKTAMNKAENFAAHSNGLDGYLSYLKAYTWGSNKAKCVQGLAFHDMIEFNIDNTLDADAERLSERYIHYIHGVNPMNKNYLSNMANYGAENSVAQFYHSWFKNGSALWDEVGVSTYGPPPGYLVGGPNPAFKFDNCCNSSCGGPTNDAKCTAEWIPTSEPVAKFYKDFNTSWPLNSWEITENSCGYQTAYIRLLSKFVADQSISVDLKEYDKSEFNIYPNPTSGQVFINSDIKNLPWILLDINGKIVLNGTSDTIDVEHLSKGVYSIKRGGVVAKIVKN